MKTRSEGTSEWVRGIVTGLAVVLTLATVSAAQEKPAVTQSTTPEQRTAAKTEDQPKGGMGEGIRVHGHWTIDVKNPDGSLASHRDFENSLVQGAGQEVLAKVLSGVWTIGSWTIVLKDSLAGVVCADPASCGLAVTIDPALVQTGVLEFKASNPPTALYDFDITSVTTWFHASSGLAAAFSRRDLAAADQQHVKGGQIIQVAVRFTFS